MTIEDGELLFSCLCADERGARYVTESFRQDLVRTGWSPERAAIRAVPAGGVGPHNGVNHGRGPPVNVSYRLAVWKKTFSSSSRPAGLTDKQVLTEAMIPWTRIDPGEQMYEYACHEDNYDIVHLLQGARTREKTGETVPKRIPER